MSDLHGTPALEEALREHHQLLEIQSRLVGRFADGSCPAFNVWIADVRRDTEELTTLLVSHFAREERDDLHAEIASALPNATHRLEALIREHRKIAGAATALHQQAQRPVSPGEDGPLRAAASEFFALLDQHERAERDLFLLAIEGDGGAPD